MPLTGPSPRRWAAALAAGTVVCTATALLLGTAPADPPADYGPDPTRLTTHPRAASAPSSASDGAPVRIDIPAVDLSAAIVPVGVDRHGSVSVPDRPDRAGWLRTSARPGTPTGSSVLVGHLDVSTGQLGQFAALTRVKPGTKILIRTEAKGGHPPAERAGTGQPKEGPPVAYRVVSRRTVHRDRLPSSLFRRDGSPTLTLITCAPPFHPDGQGYENNLLVTAVPIT